MDFNLVSFEILTGVIDKRDLILYSNHAQSGTQNRIRSNTYKGKGFEGFKNRLSSCRSGSSHFVLDILETINCWPRALHQGATHCSHSGCWHMLTLFGNSVYLYSRIANKDGTAWMIRWPSHFTPFHTFTFRWCHSSQRSQQPRDALGRRGQEFADRNRCGSQRLGHYHHWDSGVIRCGPWHRDPYPPQLGSTGVPRAT